MIQATLTEPPAVIVEPSVSGVSWAAVLAGAIASCALTLVLLSLGAGLGLAAVSPWGNSGVDNDLQNRHRSVFHRHGDDFLGHWRLPRGPSAH
jgi:hypothetical protein